MTMRDDVAARLDEHRLVRAVSVHGCTCGDWISTMAHSYQEHLADVVLFYFPDIADRSAERWDEGYTQAVDDLCPAELSHEARLLWALDHPPVGNPY
ncbi:hypothetical protein D9V37_19940 [Nocardioides mangrovicus]|uniref:Uncharacterized protein n=1 Tax=Nocardioides mangrovicus TaxID=2478913 RepID=A0A3L8P088_9ACTN|nr:hypothetical protein [Nocardioides mangrovicus]RLV48312.1 hypothetical protein D9V37_19940 [Nocardioides mangrovicus]